MGSNLTQDNNEYKITYERHHKKLRAVILSCVTFEQVLIASEWLLGIQDRMSRVLRSYLSIELEAKKLYLLNRQE